MKIIPKVRLATPDDYHLPHYSHSIMEDVLTCPKWGIIRRVQRKYFKANYRALALEAGSAMHEVFAALRLWQIKRIQGLEDHYLFHGARIFGETRLSSTFFPRDNPRDEALNFCFEILNSGEFYDDPDDRIRTMANMEDTTIRYVDEMMAVMDRNEIWVKDKDDPTAPVGVEIPFAFVVDEEFLFVGTIDGITVHVERGIRNEENKTASRPDDSWRDAFRIKHQPTGYTIASRLITGEPVEQTKIIGVKIKQTRNSEDFVSFVEHRDEEAFADWYNTVKFAHEIVKRYEADPLSAPMFTHSCHRYFRACGFIDLCGASKEDQQMMYEEMEITEASPSERAIFGDD